MTTSAPPPNYFFANSRDIQPSVHVPTYLYNANGYIPHPLQLSGHIPSFAAMPAKIPAAGITGNAPGMPAWDAGHAHLINGRLPTTNV